MRRATCVRCAPLYDNCVYGRAVVSRENSDIVYALRVGAVCSCERLAVTVLVEGGRSWRVCNILRHHTAPRASCVRFLRTQRSVPECSAIACGREGAGSSTPDELQGAEEGERLCVRECASACIQQLWWCVSRRRATAAPPNTVNTIK
ncbi:unnamed protein product [Arctia plantaginis]|uniref:Uncharacterized protein n=1 Tax=Arctia plantaginis TaxID=874455 RepID=A0A8S0Z3L4_ARCPL|nr:unnamed protein product [Arctia plantaginis]